MSTNSVAESNREAFNAFAAQYDAQPWNQRLTFQIRTALQDRKDWIGAHSISESNSDQHVKLLDYACGTGAITKALGPYVSSVKGIDLSDQMVERYNAAARESGLSEEQANAVVGNICVDEGIPEELLAEEWFNFDIAAISLGFHHFESPPLALRRLAERLKAGSGVLLIIDFLPVEEEGHAGSCSRGHGHQDAHHHGHGNHAHSHQAPAQHQHGHSHESPSHAHALPSSGFTQEGMRKMYSDAGVGADFDFVVLPEPAVLGEGEGARQRKIFIAKGRRADATL